MYEYLYGCPCEQRNSRLYAQIWYEENGNQLRQPQKLLSVCTDGCLCICSRGYRLLPKLLESVGITVDLVKEQCIPDENFSSCPIPNPERTETLELGISYFVKNKSDILIATDPDADRVGVVVRHGERYVRLTGNEVVILLTDYLLNDLYRKSGKTDSAILIKTIVTTKLAEKIAACYGAKMINVLTGFKYIGEQICRLEETGEEKYFLLGFEESCGYLLSTQVRDKDALIASLAICKMTAEYKAKGMDLIDALNSIYNRYGYSVSKLLTYEFNGVQGRKYMENFMADLRGWKNDFLKTEKVIKFTDYKCQDTGLPKSDVLSFDLEHDASIIIRPSGTEPLLKIYLTAPNDAAIDGLRKQVERFIQDYR